MAETREWRELLRGWAVGADRWCDRRPERALALCLLLVFALVGWETAGWAIRNYPGAMWHQRPRGEDIEIAWEKAAVAGPRELLGFWTGPTIVENGYFRPLASCLFVLQYHLFGREDWLWQLPSLAAHLAVALGLVLASLRLLQGSRGERLLIGTGAALLFGAPRWADYEVQRWALGWWPCQPDLYTMLCLLGVLALCARYLDAPSRTRAAQILALFALAVSFKEMGFLVGGAACLLLLRRRAAWPLVAALAAEGIGLFAYRHWALAGQSHPFPFPTPERYWHGLWVISQAFVGEPDYLFGRFLPVLLAAAVWIVPARFLDRSRAVLAAAGIYVVAHTCMNGLPSEMEYWRVMEIQLEMLSRFVGVAAVLLAVRRRGVPELILIYLATVFLVAGFPPTFPHYRYWGSVLSAWLTAIGLVELLRRLIRPAPDHSGIPAGRSPGDVELQARRAAGVGEGP